MGGRQAKERIGVVVVAYNAASTLSAVLDRLPDGFRSRVAEVVVCDDASSDSTYAVGTEYQAATDLPLTVIRRPQNLGYGGNQKAAYKWAIEHGLDIVVLLHGDGQYAPEVIEDLIRPFESTQCDAVFGSRMMDPGLARIGGMPMYKYVGNRILSTYSNALVGMNLTEWHSGYRAYRVQALRDIPFDLNSDGFDFDTEIILQLHEANKTIVEVPIPTYYGGEICHVNGFGYAKDVCIDVTRYRIHKMGFGSGEMAFAEQGYEMKLSDTSSHRKLLDWLSEGSPKRILDLGCSDGRLGELFRLEGHTVIGIDSEKLDGVGDRLDGFVEADLNLGLPDDVGRDFDVVVAADVLEHLADPESMLRQLSEVLSRGGWSWPVCPTSPTGIRAYGSCSDGSTTNGGEFSMLAISGSSHDVASSGWRSGPGSASAGRQALVYRWRSSGRGGPSPSRVMKLIAGADMLGLGLAPNLFSYQLLFELEPV